MQRGVAQLDDDNDDDEKEEEESEKVGVWNMVQCTVHFYQQLYQQLLLLVQLPFEMRCLRR